jgi:hypothetical protein
MDIKEVKAAKAELEKRISALLYQFAESTGARVVDLEIGGHCRVGMQPTYLVDAEAQL